MINSIGSPRQFGSSRRSGAKELPNRSTLLPTRVTNGCLRLPVRALPRSAINCSASRSRSWSSIG